MSVDWNLIRSSYECGGKSLRRVAEQFGVSVSTLLKRAAREQWKQHVPVDSITVIASCPDVAESPPENGINVESKSSEVATDSIGSALLEESNGITTAHMVHFDSTASDPKMVSNGINAAGMAGSDSIAQADADLPWVIPAEINEWDRAQAALFYWQKLRWAVHNLYPPDKGDTASRGKKPRNKGWRDHRAEHLTSEDLLGVFGGRSRDNIGVVLRPPFVAVDLDSKADNGQSVQKWLQERPHLIHVPRERTAGGAHLHFICPDLPEALLNARKALVQPLNDNVTAELYTSGLNLVVAPSVHKSGHRYTWEVTGEIPEVKWGVLAAWFDFALPEKKKPGGRWKPAKWWLRYSGDLHTLDMPGLCGELGLLGRCLDADKGKHAVRCPWADEHSMGTPEAEPGSDTVIFEAVSAQRLPGFKCQHAHCSERSIEHFLDAVEKAAPGIVDRRCGVIRQRGRVPVVPTQAPMWEVPDGGSRPATESMRELGHIIGPRHSMYLMNSEIVRLLNPRRQPYCTKRKDDEIRDDYATQVLTPTQFITALEAYCRPSRLVKSPDGELLAVGTVLSKFQASITLDSAEFSEALPELKHVLRAPIPVADEYSGNLLFPAPGFNDETGIFMAMDAVRARPLPPTPGNLAWAKAVLGHLLAYGHSDSFAYSTPQDECHSFARFLTPFCRGLIDWAKGPVWTFEADEAGTGKDTLADITHVQQTGCEIGYSPSGDNEEMRKGITSFLLAGGSFYHLGNVRGAFRCAPFEQASSASRIHCDRLLGQSKTLRLRNEAEYSFSANDAVFTPDILRRCRRIFQRWNGSSVNKRSFRIRGIIGWTFRNRPMVATAALTLIQAYWQWRQQNPVAVAALEFSSFPEWADTVGGLCVWAGFGNPTCDHLLDTARRDIGAPDASEDLEFLRLLHQQVGEAWQRHGELMTWVEQNAKEVLQSVLWDKDTTWKRQMGRKLAKLADKERGDFRFESRGGQHHQSRAEYRVVRRNDGGSSDAKDPRSFSSDWFQVPKVPCLDDCGNIALPAHASQLSSCAVPDAERVSVSLPIMPVFSDISCPAAGEKLTSDEKERGWDASKPCAFSIVESNGGDFPEKTGITGTPLELWPDDLPQRMRDAGMVALDLETFGLRRGDGLDPWQGEIRLLQLRVGHDAPILIDVLRAGPPPEQWRNALQAVVVVGHNLRFDALWLRAKWQLRLPKVYCTLTASRLLHAGDRSVRHDLDSVLQRHLNVPSLGNKGAMQKCDWGGLLLPDMLAYARRDVLHLEALAAVLDKQLEQTGLDKVARLEMQLLPVVTDIEAAGFAVDRDKLRSIEVGAKAAATEQAARLRQKLKLPKLNPSSPQQLLAALGSAGINVTDTHEDTLKAANDTNIIPLILGFRAAEKLAQQATTLLDCVKSDGRIHGRFDPTGTATGRFSSKEPNLQNIGRGELRSCFVPTAEHKLIVADYSQIELRAAAAIAGETKMIDAYKNGVDLHKQTAAAVLGKPADQITKGDRQTGKAVSFGNLYGQSAPGLVRYAASSYGVHLEIEQAEDIRRQFFRTYGALRQWHGESRNKAAAGSREARTVLGRRRIIPQTASEWEAFTALVNMPVQGGCADGMKQALVWLAERLPVEARIVSTVHDEVIVEVPTTMAGHVCDIVKATMVEAMAALFPQVPIEVEAGVCSNWAEK